MKCMTRYEEYMTIKTQESIRQQLMSELELVEDCCHAVPGLQPAKLTITNHSGGEGGEGVIHTAYIDHGLDP